MTGLAPHVPDRARYWGTPDELSAAVRDYRRSRQTAVEAGVAAGHPDAGRIHDRGIQPKRCGATEQRSARIPRSRSFEEMAYGWLNVGCIVATGSVFLFLVMWMIDVVRLL